MSEKAKATVEKTPQGEYVFTPYGEFLSYFHAHLEAFRRFGKARNMDPAGLESAIGKLKAHMAGNVKNVDQFFQQIPGFAKILQVPSDSLSQYLNQNFLEILPTVQEKFRETEIKKAGGNSKRYSHFTEEVLDRSGFIFPAELRFVADGNIVSILNQKSGETMEPSGLMAGTGFDTPATSAKPEAKPVPVVQFVEKPFLQELMDKFGSQFTGQKLELKSEISTEEADLPMVKVSAEDVLDDIEDLEFEEPEEEETSDSGQEIDPSILDDLGDILGTGPLKPAPPKSQPIPPEIQHFHLEAFFAILQKIQTFTAKQDTQGYNTWVQGEKPHVKAVIKIRNLIQKEQKGEAVDWGANLSGLETSLALNRPSLELLKKKVSGFSWVRLALDRSLQELRKGSPEFIQLVKMAWPHIQKAFLDSPDYDRVLGNLKVILSKIPNELHRKELVRVFQLALNFLKSKFTDPI
jgi:hypothetical protein